MRKGQYGQILGYLESVVEDSTSIDSTAVHVQVIGHSLNLTDKALLKTIFEHPNVKEIEVTYHKNESKYFEKLYNVSRIFDNNTDMRKKIVPLEKTFKII